MIDWDSEPEAMAYKPDCEIWYESWWKIVNGNVYCKFPNPEHWQVPYWRLTGYTEEVVKSIIGITFKNMEDYMTKSSIVAVYKTTDGEVFADLRDAEDHQSKVDIWNKLVEKFGCYGEIKLSYFSDFLDMMKFYEENK